IGLVFGGVMLLLLEKEVLARLTRLSQKVSEIGHSRDLSKRVQVPGDDELSKLGETINEMLEALAGSEESLRQAHAELEDRSRQLAQTNKTLEAEIVERRWVEEELRTSEERYRQTIENSPNPIFSIDLAGHILSWNRACEIAFHYGQEAIGQPYQDVLGVLDSEQEQAMERLVEEIFTQRRSFGDVEISYGRKNGAWQVMATRLYPLPDRVGQVRACVFANTDITERQQAEAQIKASLREKEILLQEIHHRVKNNMQVISSLLSLQANYVDNPYTREIFQQSQNRVRSMALVHEKLYRSQDLNRINFGEYIQDLTAYLFQVHGGHTQDIKLNIETQQVLLNIDKAVPCGLILNELISNALKHAFTNGQSGKIQIELDASANQQVTLTIADNGVGFPLDFDIQHSDSLGLKLVYTLARQLDATIERRNSAGTEFKLSFAVS
ncbi:MAG: histidine kinase dimerization/phosphoacceptor domain -containing protein, partial [Chloroflexota bacterium]